MTGRMTALAWAVAAQHVAVPQRPGRLSFAAHGARNLGQTGTVLRTAGHAADFLLDMAAAELSRARLVVELGAGDGAVTGRILRRIPWASRLVACEIDPGLAADARVRVSDRRAAVECRPAAEVLGEYRGRADVVVSTLPLLAFTPRERQFTVGAAMAALSEGGVLLQLQYSARCRPVLQAWAAEVDEVRYRHGLPWAWLFPLHLYACRGPQWHPVEAGPGIGSYVPVPSPSPS